MIIVVKKFKRHSSRQGHDSLAALRNPFQRHRNILGTTSEQSKFWRRNDWLRPLLIDRWIFPVSISSQDWDRRIPRNCSEPVLHGIGLGLNFIGHGVRKKAD